jgi:hypothetical protein
MIGVAPEEAQSGQPEAPTNTMTLNCLKSILGTTRSEPARGCEGRRNPTLILYNHKPDRGLHRTYTLAVRSCRAGSPLHVRDGTTPLAPHGLCTVAPGRRHFEPQGGSQPPRDPILPSSTRPAQFCGCGSEQLPHQLGGRAPRSAFPAMPFLAQKKSSRVLHEPSRHIVGSWPPEKRSFSSCRRPQTVRR